MKKVIPMGILMLLAGAGIFLVALKIGSVPFTWRQVFTWLAQALTGRIDWAQDPSAAIFFQIRLPRVIMAGLVGALLATTGAVLQSLFRNPLADPYLLGISSGAALGAVAGLLLGLAAPAPMACAGAVGSLILVLLCARVQGATSVTMMILTGAAVHSLASAVLTLLLSLASQKFETASILFWLLGSLDTLPYRLLLPLLAFSILAVASLMLWAPALNLLAQGEEAAQTLGLPVEKTKWILILLCALAVGLSVTFNGMIPFVGLVVPHIARLLWGTDHRRLLPAACLLGAVLVMAADAGGRVLLSPQEIPTGVVTALAGAPFFLYILRRERRRLL